MSVFANLHGFNPANGLPLSCAAHTPSRSRRGATAATFAARKRRERMSAGVPPANLVGLARRFSAGPKPGPCRLQWASWAALANVIPCTVIFGRVSRG